MGEIRFVKPTCQNDIGWGFWGKSGTHHALDINGLNYFPVVAIADGNIYSIAFGGNGGNEYPNSEVQIIHKYHIQDGANGKTSLDYSFKSLYTHMRFIAVKKGESVKKGQIIGFVGGYNPDQNNKITAEPGGGNTEVPHLHFQLMLSVIKGDIKGQYVLLKLGTGNDGLALSNKYLKDNGKKPSSDNNRIISNKLLLELLNESYGIVWEGFYIDYSASRSAQDLFIKFLSETTKDKLIVSSDATGKIKDSKTIKSIPIDSINIGSAWNKIYNDKQSLYDKCKPADAFSFEIMSSKSSFKGYQESDDTYLKASSVDLTAQTNVVGKVGNTVIDLAAIVSNYFYKNVFHKDLENNNTVRDRFYSFLIPLLQFTFPQEHPLHRHLVKTDELRHFGFNKKMLDDLGNNILDFYTNLDTEVADTFKNQVTVNSQDFVKLEKYIVGNYNKNNYLLLLAEYITQFNGSNFLPRDIAKFRGTIESIITSGMLPLSCLSLLGYYYKYSGNGCDISKEDNNVYNAKPIRINGETQKESEDKENKVIKGKLILGKKKSINGKEVLSDEYEYKDYTFKNCKIVSYKLIDCIIDCCIVHNIECSGAKSKITNSQINMSKIKDIYRIEDSDITGCTISDTRIKTTDGAMKRQLDFSNITSCDIANMDIRNSTLESKGSRKGIYNSIVYYSTIRNYKIQDTSIHTCTINECYIYVKDATGIFAKHCIINNTELDGIIEVYKCNICNSNIKNSKNSLHDCTINNCSIDYSFLANCDIGNSKIFASKSYLSNIRSSEIGRKKYSSLYKVSFEKEFEEDDVLGYSGRKNKPKLSQSESSLKTLTPSYSSSSSPSSTNFDLFSQDFKFDAPQAPKRQSQPTGGSASSGSSGGGSKGQAKVTGLDNIGKEKDSNKPDFGKMIQDFFKAQAGGEIAGAASGGESGGGSSGGSSSSSSETAPDETKSDKKKGKQDFRNILQNMPFFNKVANSRQNDDKKQKMPDLASLVKSVPSQSSKSKNKEKSSNLPSFIGPPKLNFVQPQMPSAPSAGGAGGRVSDFGSSAPKPPSSQANKPASPKSKQKPQMPPMPSLQQPMPPKSQKPVANTASPASSATSSPASSAPEDKGQKKGEDKGLAQALDGKNAEKAKAQFAPKIVDLPNNYAKNKSVLDKGEDFIGSRMPGTGAMESALPQPMTVPDFERGAMTGKPSRRSEKMAPKIINRTIKEPDVKLTIRKPPKVDDAIEFARKLGNEQFIESMRMQ